LPALGGAALCLALSKGGGGSGARVGSTAGAAIQQVKLRDNASSPAAAPVLPGAGPEGRPAPKAWLQHVDAGRGPTTGVAFSTLPAAAGSLWLAGSLSGGAGQVVAATAATAAAAAASEAASVRVGMMLQALKALILAVIGGGASKDLGVKTSMKEERQLPTIHGDVVWIDQVSTSRQSPP